MIKKYNEFNHHSDEISNESIKNFSDFESNDSITEDAEYYISKNGEEIQVTKHDFIKLGADNNFQPKLNGEKGFSIKKSDNKIVAKIDESKD
jgi:hypothetical protein